MSLQGDREFSIKAASTPSFGELLPSRGSCGRPAGPML